jgi:hypothetical protein
VNRKDLGANMVTFMKRTLGRVPYDEAAAGAVTKPVTYYLIITGVPAFCKTAFFVLIRRILVQADFRDVSTLPEVFERGMR